MKLLVLLFLVFPFMGGADAPVDSSTNPEVIVSVKLVDGTEITKSYLSSELAFVTSETLGFDAIEVIECTAIGANGKCKTTGPNCAAAVAGTIACLKEANGETP